MLKLIICGLLGILVSACATMPGQLEKAESKVDGTSEVSVTPGWLQNTTIKLGVYRNSKMEPNKAIMQVALELQALGLGESLKINIDGETKSFKSIDQLSSLGSGQHLQNFFIKRYEVDLDYLKKMVEGKSVWVKVSTIKGGYVEGEFSYDGYITAKPGFKKFLAEVKK